MRTSRRRGLLTAIAAVSVATLALTGCSKTEDAAAGGDSSADSAAVQTTDSPAAANESAADTGTADAAASGSDAGSGSDTGGSAGETGGSAAGTDASSGGGAAGSQVVASGSADGPTCTIADYGGKPFDLTKVKVGFSQSEKEDNPFRIAETKSIKDEAKKLGIELEATNAQTNLNKQISDIKDLLNKNVKFLIVAPLNSDGLEPAFQAAKEKGVPILTIDRKVNMEPCKDYVSFLGSNFVEQGKRAANLLAEAMGNKGKVAILLGSAGNNVTEDRTKGFLDELKVIAPDIEVVAQQTGEFARDKGQQVTAQLIQSNPEITGIYAENDEMGIGAVNALEAAGKKPGSDVKIVSVDGTKNAVQLIVDGKYNGVVESNPRFGPLAFSTAIAFTSGEPVGQNVIISDTEYTPENAKEKLAGAF